MFLSLSALPRLYPAGVGHAMPYHPEVVVVVVVVVLVVVFVEMFKHSG